MERTLVLLKPDAVQRGLIGELIQRFERRGLKVVAMRLVSVGLDLARQHYAVHAGQPFFDGLIAYITSGPVVALALEGPEAIQVVRDTVGKTRPAEAAAGSIRADYGLCVGRNLVHASDGPDTARQELALWFRPEDFVSYPRDIDRWILD